LLVLGKPIDFKRRSGDGHIQRLAAGADDDPQERHFTS
jgi:hypothetical protein